MMYITLKKIKVNNKFLLDGDNREVIWLSKLELDILSTLWTMPPNIMNRSGYIINAVLTIKHTRKPSKQKIERAISRLHTQRIIKTYELKWAVNNKIDYLSTVWYITDFGKSVIIKAQRSSNL